MRMVEAATNAPVRPVLLPSHVAVLAWGACLAGCAASHTSVPEPDASGEAPRPDGGMLDLDIRDLAAAESDADLAGPTVRFSALYQLHSRWIWRHRVISRMDVYDGAGRPLTEDGLGDGTVGVEEPAVAHVPASAAPYDIRLGPVGVTGVPARDFDFRAPVQTNRRGSFPSTRWEGAPARTLRVLEGASDLRVRVRTSLFDEPVIADGEVFDCWAERTTCHLALRGTDEAGDPVYFSAVRALYDDRDIVVDPADRGEVVTQRLRIDLAEARRQGLELTSVEPAACLPELSEAALVGQRDRMWCPRSGTAMIATRGGEAVASARFPVSDPPTTHIAVTFASPDGRDDALLMLPVDPDTELRFEVHRVALLSASAAPANGERVVATVRAEAGLHGFVEQSDRWTGAKLGVGFEATGRLDWVEGRWALMSTEQTTWVGVVRRPAAMPWGIPRLHRVVVRRRFDSESFDE